MRALRGAEHYPYANTTLICFATRARRSPRPERDLDSPSRPLRRSLFGLDVKPSLESTLAQGLTRSKPTDSGSRRAPSSTCQSRRGASMEYETQRTPGPPPSSTPMDSAKTDLGPRAAAPAAVKSNPMGSCPPVPATVPTPPTCAGGGSLSNRSYSISWRPSFWASRM